MRKDRAVEVEITQNVILAVGSNQVQSFSVDRTADADRIHFNIGTIIL